MAIQEYGGKNESPGKHRVRSWEYSLLKRPDLYTKHHIVIASKDCGDIRYLLSLGVAPSKIIACDIDPAARVKAKEFGVVVSPYPSVQDTVLWAIASGFKIASINVDLCASLVEACPILAPVLDAATCLQAAACLVFFTYRRGRDAAVLRRYSKLHADDARKLYLMVEAGRFPDLTDTYHSFTRTSQGSAMAANVFTIRGKPGLKPKVELPKRKYGCSACGGVDLPHPMIHRKLCKYASKSV